MIYLNLIPSNIWYLNLRKLLTEQQWIDLSKQVRTDQNWTCFACGISIKQLKSTKFFDCHEMWDFNDQTCQVELKCLLCLCKKCHNATHFGRATANNKGDNAFKHLCKVNKWDSETTKIYLEGCFEQWSQRSHKPWTMDWNSFVPWLNEDLIVTAQLNYKHLMNEITKKANK